MHGAWGMGRTAKQQVQLNERVEKDRAHALALKGKFDEAIRIYRALLAQRDDAALYQSLGDVCRKRGLLDDAVKAYFSAAKQLEAQGHLPRARAALAVALQLAPGEPKLVGAMNALRAAPAPRPVVTPPLPDRVKRHLALVPPPVARVEEVGDDDILDSGEPLPVITAQKPQRGATREVTPVSAGSLLEELLAGVPDVQEPATPALPPEIAAIFAAPPKAAPKHRSVDDLLALPPKQRTGSNPRLHRPANPNAKIPADIAAIFEKPVAPAPERRRNTRPPPPVPSLLGNDDDVLDSGFEHILDHVFSSDDTERTDPFCPRWPEQSSSRETVVARPRGKVAAKARPKTRVPSYPRV